MTEVIFDIEPVPHAGTGRRSARLLARGRFRKAIKKLNSALKAVYGEDDRERARATEQGYTPFLFATTNTNKIGASMAKIWDRTIETLAARS